MWCPTVQRISVACLGGIDSIAILDTEFIHPLKYPRFLPVPRRFCKFRRERLGAESRHQRQEYLLFTFGYRSRVDCFFLNGVERHS